MSESKLKRFFGTMLYYLIIVGFILMLLTTAIALMLFDKWRWSCGG